MATMEEMAPPVRAFLSTYGWHRIDPVPWALPSKPLASSRVGLVVTACMTMPGQAPFTAEAPDNDPSIRIVPSDTDPAVLVNTFPGQAFDHTGLAEDANVLIPLERLADMAAAGEIGGVSPRTVSLCGHLPKPRRLIEETAPAIARMFLEDGADAVVLVPA
jgi:hypothetical protein